MKKRVTKPDGTVEEMEGTAQEFAELERETKPGHSPMKPLDVKPFVPQPVTITPAPPNDRDPWLRFGSTDIVFDQQPCAVREYFRQHPEATSITMVCTCPMCSTWCYGGVATGSTGIVSQPSAIWQVDAKSLPLYGGSERANDTGTWLGQNCMTN